MQKKVQRWLNKCFFPFNKSAPIYNDAFKNAQLPGAEDTILPTNSSVWKETFLFSIKLKCFFFVCVSNRTLRRSKQWGRSLSRFSSKQCQIHHWEKRNLGNRLRSSWTFTTSIACFDVSAVLICRARHFKQRCCLCIFVFSPFEFFPVWFFFLPESFSRFFSGYLDGLVFFSTPSKSDPFSFPCLNFDNPWYTFYFASVLVLGIWCLPPQQRGVWWLLLDRSFRVLNKWCGQPIPSKQSKYPAGVRRLQTRNTQR